MDVAAEPRQADILDLDAPGLVGEPAMHEMLARAVEIVQGDREAARAPLPDEHGAVGVEGHQATDPRGEA